MDPNAALQRIVTAAEEGDAEELIEAAQDLAEWLNKGGFVPTPVVLVRRFGGDVDPLDVAGRGVDPQFLPDVEEARTALGMIPAVSFLTAWLGILYLLARGI